MSRSTMRLALALAALLAAAEVTHISLGANGKEGAGDQKQAATVVELPEVTAVEKALEKQVSIKLQDAPLKDVAAKLADLSGVNVLVDEKAVMDLKDASGFKFTFEMNNVRLGAAIRELLAEHDLGYGIPEGNVLLITSARMEESVARVYNVEDLLLLPGPVDEFTGLPPREDVSFLAGMIVRNVRSSSWADNSNSGGGAIVPLAGCLYVSQKPEIHREIASLLAGLRKAQCDEKSGATPTNFLIGSTPAEDQIRSRLERRQDVDFNEITISGLTDYLAAQGVPVRLDHPHRTHAGIALNSTFSLKAKQVPLKFALRVLLRQHDMNYLIIDGSVVLTTDSVAKETDRVGVYPVADLVQVESGDGRIEFDFDSLIELITSEVAPTSWPDDGGIGVIDPYTNPIVLIIPQTEEVHEQIADLLSQLRAARRAAHELDAAKAPVPTKGEMVVRIYHVGKREDVDVGQYIAAIRNLIEPKSWTDGSGYISRVPGAIVVRNTPAVQKRIDDLLADLNCADAQNGDFGTTVAPKRRTSAVNPKPAVSPPSNPSGTPPPGANPPTPRATTSGEPKPLATPNAKE